MAQRRSSLTDLLTPPSPMTPRGGSGEMYDDPQTDPMIESKDTFRRRTSPIIGSPTITPTTLQQVLAMLRGS